MTADIRESHIAFRFGSNTGEPMNFKFSIKVNFGKNKYQENTTKISDLGVEPSNNVIVVTHEFMTEEAAQEAVPKINEVFEKVSSQLGPFAASFEEPKIHGKTLIVLLRIPELYTGKIASIEPILSTVAETTTENQYFEIVAEDYIPPKDSSSTESNTPMKPKYGYLKFLIALHKDIFKSIANIAAGMDSGDTKDIMTAAEVLSSVNHFYLDFDIGSDSGLDTNNSILSGTMMGAQVAYGLAGQLGILDVAKAAGTLTTVTFCISPAISFEVVLLAPNTIVTIESLVNASQT